MADFDTVLVADYYDRHTRAFAAWGQGGGVGAIHRAVWGPDVRDALGAFHYVEDRIAELVHSLPPSASRHHIVDLGCGVGASVCYLARLLPVLATGITLSTRQAKLAGRRIAEAGLTTRVRCIRADYMDLPLDVPRADLAFAIESFVHAPDPTRFFEQCARLVRPGGVLVICDDFRRTLRTSASERVIGEFREGWHVNTLISADELRGFALEAGFAHERTTDLSSYLEIHRTRDRLVAGLLWPLRAIPAARRWCDYLFGGHALQLCLARGWIGYDLVVFRRRESRQR
jgi:SAM-dependent methyltransferase